LRDRLRSPKRDAHTAANRVQDADRLDARL
jgi:hypothetical protein